MKRPVCLIGMALFLLFSHCDVPKQESGRGHLLIVGGGDKPPDALQEFVALCQGGPIVVITSASASPESSGPDAVELFRQAGAVRISWLHIAGPDTADSDSVAEQLATARGVFFTGGVQSRLMARIRGTRAAQAILQLYNHNRGIIGGTSAGAAVQSEIMITGEGDFSILTADNIETATGLGLLTHCIIDQHFIARQRQNRLLSLVIEKHLPGIGIDEDTAILYRPDDTFRVYGSGSVVVYDPEKSRRFVSEPGERLAAENIRLAILRAGQVYDLRKNRLIL
ncbi:cyanophycinase [candidate division KSB1 bacterium]|nr:cyanophycinase [candidate division KSB1 bacterium]